MSSELRFTKVKTGRASEEIALQIQSAILDETLLPGDNLPSERELQQQFGTGRGVIREAIQTLKQKGLIEIRKGAKGGAFVKQVEVTNISESLSLFLKQKHIGAQDVAEFRESIDQTVALLAMVRATDAQKTQLMQWVSHLETVTATIPHDMDGPGETQAQALGEADRQLNLLLAEMAGNPIFGWVMDALQQGFSSYDHNLYDDPDYCRQTVANWRLTATALIQQQPLQLQSAISHHYQLLRACLARMPIP